MKKILIMISLLLFSVTMFSQTRERQRESYYQQKFAEIVDGEREVVLRDRTRVDILTETHAIEVDFGEKWAESIGQSLHYEGMTHKRAGVLLVLDIAREERFLDRLVGVAAKHGIDVWVWDWKTDEWSKIDYTYEIKYLY